MAVAFREQLPFCFKEVGFHFVKLPFSSSTVCFLPMCYLPSHPYRLSFWSSHHRGTPDVSKENKTTNFFTSKWISPQPLTVCGQLSPPQPITSASKTIQSGYFDDHLFYFLCCFWFVNLFKTKIKIFLRGLSCFL